MDGDRGTNYPSQKDFAPIGHCLFLNTGNVTKDGFNFSNCAFISPEKDAALRKGKLNREDVVLTTRGTVGNVAHFNDEVPYEHVRINSGMVILRAEQRQLSSHFLYLFVRSALFSEQVKALQSGSAQPQLPIRDMKQIEMPIPPLSEQAAICTTLGALDDRITLLRETNATLEAIAQALFKSWFVDFDPVRAKMEGRTPEGMDEATAALFPDGFETSELGEVPRGWRFGVIGDFALLRKGSVNPGSKPKTTFEHFSLPAFDAGQRPIFELGDAIKSNKTLVTPDAVLLSKLNPHIPRIWLPVECGSTAVCSTEFLVFVPTGIGSRELIYCAFSSPDFIAKLQQLVTGTSNSHQRIKPDQVALMASVVPTADVAQEFEAAVKPIFQKVFANREQAQTLTALRDTLLPRLISGQLRLPDAQAATAEALAR